MPELALLQTALPGGFILWLFLGRAPCRADLLLRLPAGWLLLLGVALAGVWLALPFATVWVLAALILVASFVAARRVRQGGSAGGADHVVRWSGRIAAGAVLALGLWLVVPALAGRTAPQPAVDLAFPFRSGRYLVANGGATERINGHLMTLEPRFARWRGESYAVDLIKVDEFGFRTRRPGILAMPSDPAAYLTFGEPVHAPCSGLVEATEEERPDMPVPIRDRPHLEGNFVRLRCGDLIVLLGHFHRGAIEVQVGDRVQAGDLLGRAGNSGNSDEPHLHIHAQWPGTAAEPLSGVPVFITFDGRFLARNMLVDAR